jgi:ubiquinone/menaquinone biosynthesis C-methylase UbiE
MDKKKTEEFSERILNEINSGLSCLNLYLGHKLKLFEKMGKSGWITSEDLAQQTGYNKRYLEEWLNCMAVNEYVEFNENDETYFLPPEHHIAMNEFDDPNYVSAFLCWIPSLAGVLQPLMKAFETGSGVPYVVYGTDTLEAVGMGNRPMFVNDLISSWIPSLPDIQKQLKNGAKVADIGCGVGWSSISLAKAFPKVQIDAFDPDEASINQARVNANSEGVEKQISFHLKAAEDIRIDDIYDLVCAFECIHDMAYPVKALSKMKEMIKEGGTVLISDEAAGETLSENSNFLGRFLYNFSVLHCLPQAMVFPDSAKTGTVMSVSTLKKYAESAGFSKFNILPIENPFWRFYGLTP